MVRSFFDPNWPDIAGLGSYGRTLGVNWIWSLDLIVFHAVYSIAIPNLPVGLLFPNARERRWTGRTGFIILCAILAVDVVLGGYAITRYVPPLIPCAGAVILAPCFVVLGRFLPDRNSASRTAAPPPGKTPAHIVFLLTGLLGAVGYFILNWVVPGTGLPPIATGALLFVVALAPFVQMDRNRKDDTRGMALVGLAMAVFLAAVLLIVLRRRVRGAVGQAERKAGRRAGP